MMRLLGFFRGLLFTTWPCHQGNQALREIKIWHNLFRNGGHKLHWGQQYSLKRNFWTPGHPDCLEEGLYFRGRGPRLTSSWTAWSERWKPWPWWRRCRCRALPARGPSPLCFRCPVRGAHILNSKSYIVLILKLFSSLIVILILFQYVSLTQWSWTDCTPLLMKRAAPITMSRNSLKWELYVIFIEKYQTDKHLQGDTSGWGLYFVDINLGSSPALLGQ